MKRETDERSRNSVLRQIKALRGMSFPELKEKWRDLYGAEPPGYKRSCLERRLIHRVQEIFYGGLSGETEKRLEQRASADPLAMLAPEAPAVGGEPPVPGTRFIREWNGERHEVTATPGGFEYRGILFRSLSAAAREITGTRWNGRRFFGVKP